MRHGFRIRPRLLLILRTPRCLRRQAKCSSVAVIPERMGMKVTRIPLQDLLRGESAAGMVEYVLLAALLVLAAYFALHHLDRRIARTYNQIDRKF
jgi:Flp pilus assembly pilin Flp